MYNMATLAERKRVGVISRRQDELLHLLNSEQTTSCTLSNSNPWIETRIYYLRFFSRFHLLMTSVILLLFRCRSGRYLLGKFEGSLFKGNYSWLS